MMKSKNKINKIISITALVIVAAVVAYIGTSIIKTSFEQKLYDTYKTLEFSREALYGVDGDNLKDFIMTSDDKLRSVTDDPWIRLPLNGDYDILSVDIIYSTIQDNNWGTVGVNDNYISYPVVLGCNTISFEEYAGGSKASSLRLDLVSSVDEIVAIDYVVVNSKDSVQQYIDRQLPPRFERFCFASMFLLLAIISVFIMLKQNDKVLVSMSVVLGMLSFACYVSKYINAREYLVSQLLALIVFLVPVLGKNAKDVKRFILGRETINALIMTGALAFFVSLYMPLELYLTNQNEFWYDLHLMLPGVLKTFAMCWYHMLHLAIGIILVNKKFANIVFAIFAVIYVTAYIHSTFLTKKLPALDGREMNWDIFYKEGVVSFLIVGTISVVVSLLVLVFKNKAVDIMGKIMIATSLILLITLVTLTIQNKGLGRKSYLYSAEDNIMTLSSEDNFIVIVLDTVDGAAVEDVISENAELGEIFQGFTFYTDTLGAYPFTSRAIPFILSGVWFENERPYQEWLTEAYTDSAFISELQEEQYDISIYTDTLPQSSYKSNEVMDVASNFLSYNPSIKSFREFFRYQMSMVGFRALPYGLKKYANVQNVSQFDFKDTSYESTEWLFMGSMKRLYDKLQNEKFEVTPDKQFRFIHMDGAHSPFTLNEYMQETDESSYVEEVRGSITFLDAYLSKLKEQGIYDNSRIIIMSDHGFYYGEREWRKSPLLMIKGRDERHPLELDAAPISYEDLQQAYSRLMRDEDKLFDWEEGDERTRRYLGYSYLEEDYIRELYQYGDLSNSLVTTGVEYIE